MTDLTALTDTELATLLGDAYTETQRRATLNGRLWTSTVAANTWAPGVYGWTDNGPAGHR